MKFLWFDCEATGTDPVKNGVIQVAGLVYIHGQEKETFNFTCDVHPDDVIEQGALDVNGITREQIAGYPDPIGVYSKFKVMLDKYINKFDKQDKFFAAGQNINFDVQMMYEFFKKHADDPYFFSYVHAPKFDTLNLAMMVELKLKKKIFKPNYKLESLCKCMDVKLDNAHDALADIRATREVALKMWAIITGGNNG